MAVMRYPSANDLIAPLFEELLSRPQDGRMRNLLRAPDADVLETETEIRVLLDAPGMRPSDIEISLENNLLTVSGERQPEWRESEEVRFKWHLSERRYGKFNRSFILPRDVDADRIEAGFEDGVLSISVPKSEKVRRRRIEVRSGDRSRQIDASTGG